MLALFAFAQSVSLSNHKRRTQCHNVNRNTLNSLRKISIDLQKWAPQEHVYFETSEIVFDNIEKHHLKLKQNSKQINFQQTWNSQLHVEFRRKKIIGFIVRTQDLNGFRVESTPMNLPNWMPPNRKYCTLISSNQKRRSFAYLLIVFD